MTREQLEAEREALSGQLLTVMERTTGVRIDLDEAKVNSLTHASYQKRIAEKTLELDGLKLERNRIQAKLTAVNSQIRSVGPVQVEAHNLTQRPDGRPMDEDIRSRFLNAFIRHARCVLPDELFVEIKREAEESSGLVRAGIDRMGGSC